MIDETVLPIEHRVLHEDSRVVPIRDHSVVRFLHEVLAKLEFLAVDLGDSPQLSSRVREIRDDVLEATLRLCGSGAPLTVDLGCLNEATALLTNKEADILHHVAKGETNLQIARALALSPNTVKSYWKNCLQKLGAHNRVEALNVARRAGWL
jgi:DNA-binding CsgD family transcriptional regulator